MLPITRDFAFVLNANVPASDVIKAVTEANKELITNVTVFDVFEGDSLAADGKKSLGVEVTLTPRTATMRNKEIEAMSDRIIESVKKATGGVIRS